MGRGREGKGAEGRGAGEKGRELDATADPLILRQIYTTWSPVEGSILAVVQIGQTATDGNHPSLSTPGNICTAPLNSSVIHMQSTRR